MLWICDSENYSEEKAGDIFRLPLKYTYRGVVLVLSWIRKGLLCLKMVQNVVTIQEKNNSHVVKQPQQFLSEHYRQDLVESLGYNYGLCTNNVLGCCNIKHLAPVND